MKKFSSHGTLFALLLTPAAVFGEPLFFRTQPYVYEPRFERNCLSTLRVNLMGGGTSKGYKGNHNSSTLLNIYGWQNFQYLGSNASLVGAPTTDVNSDLINLTQLDPNGNFGNVQYNGKFNYFEADIYIAQNICRGFFVDLNLPIIDAHIKNTTYTDQSPATGMPNINNADWQYLKANLSTILSTYSLSAGNCKSSGVGDMRISLGWTMNNEDLGEHVDFLDTTIKLGVITPTGKKKNQNEAFSIALGYNKHVGIPVVFDIALGFYEWVTLGAHVEGIFFAHKTQNLRMQTSTAQNGWIKLNSGDAKYAMGHIWDIGAFLKADHVFKGFSLMFAYTYTSKSSDTLTPVNTTLFPTATVNNDSMYQGWKAQAIHASVEYDFAREGKRYNPLLNIFYTQPVAGKYIFKTRTGGGYGGVNVAWDF